MRKIFLVFTLLLFGIIVNAQKPDNYTTINARYYWLAGKFKTLLLNDTTLLSEQEKSYPAIASRGDTLWIWSVDNQEWATPLGISGANNYLTAGVFADDTITLSRSGLSPIKIDLNNRYLKLSDSASMLATYLRAIDTSGHWITDIYQRNDTVFYILDGTETFAYEQTGSGVSDGDKGDITVASGVWTIDNSVIEDANIVDVAFSKITGTPTTLAGYGITDGLTQADADLLYKAITAYNSDTTAKTWDWGDITGKPTVASTLAGLDDVTLTALANGDYLKYNSGTGEWNNVTESSLIQNMAVTDLTATGHRLHDWADYQLKVHGLGELELKSTVSGSRYSQIADAKPYFSGFNLYTQYDASNTAYISLNNANNASYLYFQTIKPGATTNMWIRPDSIDIRPHLGRINIDTLAEASNMTNKKVAVWDEVTGRLEQINKDSVGTVGAGGDYNLIQADIGTLGEAVVVARNDSLLGRRIVGQTFIALDTLTTGEIYVRLDTANADLKTYIALYGNDGGGGVSVIDSIQEVTDDDDMTGNIAINTTLNRITYKSGFIKYHVAFTDSTDETPASGYDADAQAYFDAIDGAGGSLTTPQKDAIDDLVVELKAASIFSTHFDYLHILVGGSEAATKFNLVDPQNTDAAYRLSFTNGATYASTGVTTNGTNQYINTHYIPASSAIATESDFHVSVFNRTSGQTAGFTWGVNDNVIAIYGLVRNASDNSIIRFPDIAQNTFADATTGKGFYLANKNTTAPNFTYRKDGVTKISEADNGNTTSLPGTYKLTYNAYNNIGTIEQYRAGELVLLSAGKAFDTTQKAAFETAVANFITALGL